MRISDLCRIAHEDAKRNGWHDGPPRTEPDMIALVNSELSEALEELRKLNPDGSLRASEKIPGFSGLEEEIADVFIRLGDYCGMKGLRVEDAISAKLAYNRKRGYKHGGKQL